MEQKVAKGAKGETAELLDSLDCRGGRSSALPVAISVGSLAPGGASAPRRAFGCPESDEGSEKRCVQAYLWQGVGVVAVYVYATGPDNAATGRPGRAGFSAKGSPQLGVQVGKQKGTAIKFP